MDTLFRVEMLGLFRVQQECREITRFRTQKTASLLACLSSYPSRSHPRDVLIEQYWHNSELQAARTNLSVALNALRRQLEPPGIPAGTVLIADHAQVRLNPVTFTTDVKDFADTVREAELESEPAKRLASWITAVDLYRGDLMPGFYEDWVLTERERLRDAYLTALRSTIKDCAELRQHERAIEYAHRMVQADPFREESHRLLIRLLMGVGRPHDALHQYQELERLLRNELQTVPSAATRELVAPLRQLPPSRHHRQQASVSGNIPRESIVDVPSSLPDTPRPPRRIPLQFTRFFGREEEITHLTDWLYPDTPPSCPLVTLTGPGGTGKTRLSIEVGGHLKEAFVGGIWFVPLAEVNDPLRLGEELRDALELPPQTRSSALDQVIAFLRGKEKPTLLILDNFEQITAGGAPVIWTLLNRVPLLRCLVTSRHPLSLPGEREYPVLPLPVPTGRKGTVEAESKAKKTSSIQQDSLALSELIACPSVALFVDRAQAVRPDFQLTPRNAEAIITLCAKLEGIPLAIELAAARARALTPAQILERLAQRFELLSSPRTDKEPRHRSLWAAIDWSYHLLSPPLQHVFAQLSVFRGGWTLEAAEAVIGTQEPDQNTQTPEFRNMLDCLAELRGHSLILAEESSATLRFRMLETLREFAAEQLTFEEQKKREQHHAAYFHQWATSAHLGGAERTHRFERFEEDFDNLRAALEWSLQQENALEIGLQTASAMGSFWWLRGHLSEGREWYRRLIDCAGEMPLAGMSRSLCGAGTLAYMQGDFQSALLLFGRCMRVAQESSDEALIGTTQEMLGCIAYRQGDYPQARFHFETSLEVACAQGTPLSIASLLGNLANVAQSSGDFTTSRALNEESLEIWRKQGDQNGEGRTLHNLANLARSQGRLVEARSLYEQSLEVKRKIADSYSISITLRGIAEVATIQGDYAAAAASVRESLAMTRELEAHTELVEVLGALTKLVRALGEGEISATMYGTLEKSREEMNYPLSPVDQAESDQIQATLREALGTVVYQAAKTQGRNLSLEQALNCLEEVLANRGL